MLAHLRALFGQRPAPPEPPPPQPPSPVMVALLDAIARRRLLDRLDTLIKLDHHILANDSAIEHYEYPRPPAADLWGFSVLLDVANGQFFIHRVGGFAYVNDMYQGDLHAVLGDAA